MITILLYHFNQKLQPWYFLKNEIITIRTRIPMRIYGFNAKKCYNTGTLMTTALFHVITFFYVENVESGQSTFLDMEPSPDVIL